MVHFLLKFPPGCILTALCYDPNPPSPADAGLGQVGGPGERGVLHSNQEAGEAKMQGKVGIETVLELAREQQHKNLRRFSNHALILASLIRVVHGRGPMG